MKFINQVLAKLSHNKVTVLAFHKVPRECERIAPTEPGLAEFIHTVELIASIFPVISLHDAVTRIKNDDLHDGAVCLTFDDGYKDWLDTVVPFMQRRNMPATFFVTTGQLEGTPLWHERVRHVISQAKETCLDITDPQMRRRIDLHNLQDRVRIVRNFEQALKAKTVAVRDHLIHSLEVDADVSNIGLPRLKDSDIKRLHESGFEIGAHSVHHPILTQCDAEQARLEIRESKLSLERIIGAKVRYFAYPNGRRADFNSQHVNFVREAGYEHAFTTEGGTLSRSTSQYEMPRFTPWGPSANRTAWQMARNLF